MPVPVMKPMAETIDAYFLRCNEGVQYRGYIAPIENSLEALQSYVGGLIEAVSLTPQIVVVCNEEGKLFQLPFNRALKAEAQVQDYFVGDILCLRQSGDEFAGIEPEDIAEIEQRLIPLKSVVRTRDYLLFTMFPADCCPEYHE